MLHIYIICVKVRKIKKTPSFLNRFTSLKGDSMQIKQVQDFLKNQGKNFSQKNIKDALRKLGKKLSDFETVEAVAVEVVKQSTALSTDTKPDTLALPDEVHDDEVEIDSNNTNSHRTQNQTFDRNQQVIATADEMATQTVELAKQLPYLYRNFTAQKYNDALPEINANWAEVDEEIFTKMFSAR